MDGKKCVISMFVKEAMGTGHTLGDARFWRRVSSAAADALATVVVVVVQCAAPVGRRAAGLDVKRKRVSKQSQLSSRRRRRLR